MLPFAAAALRADQATMRRLGNARARVGDVGMPFTVIFESTFGVELGIDVVRPAATALAADVRGVAEGAALWIDQMAGAGEAPGVDAVLYRVVTPEADDGFVRLLLETPL